MNHTDLVVVTFYPSVQMLDRMVDSISSQVRYIYIVDNTPGGFKSFRSFDKKRTIIKHLGSNTGIANALNVGIRESLRNHSEYIILSDQDTVYPDNYVEMMIQCFHLHKDKKDIAAIAPLFKDVNKSSLDDGFIEETFFGFKKKYPNNGIHNISHAISSGLFVKSSAIKNIGFMFEDLFIDWVDIEWCWRARKMGYCILGNADIKIEHSLGDSSLNIGIRHVNYRSYVRSYYITRNSFYLATRCKSINILHRIVIFLKSFRYLIGFPVLFKPRLKNALHVWLGLFHGIAGKLGKLKTGR